MIPIAILAAVVALAFIAWRIRRRFGAAGVWFVAAGCSLLGAAGVVSERWFGPNWSWNFAHHGPDYAIGALSQAAVFAVIGLAVWSRKRVTRPRRG